MTLRGFFNNDFDVDRHFVAIAFILILFRFSVAAFAFAAGAAPEFDGVAPGLILAVVFVFILLSTAGGIAVGGEPGCAPVASATPAASAARRVSQTCRAIRAACSNFILHARAEKLKAGRFKGASLFHGFRLSGGIFITNIWEIGYCPQLNLI